MGSQRLVQFQTFDKIDEETLPDQQKDKDNDKDKYIQRTPSQSDPRDLCPLRYLSRVMRGNDLSNKKTITKTTTKTKTMTIPETCGI